MRMWIAKVSTRACDAGESREIESMEANFLKSLYNTRVLESELEFEMKQASPWTLK